MPQWSRSRWRARWRPAWYPRGGLSSGTMMPGAARAIPRQKVRLRPILSRKASVKGILEPNLIGVSLKFQPARPTSTTWTNAEVVLQRGTEGVIVPGLSLRSKETQLMDNPSSVEPAITPTQYCNRVMSQHMDRPRKVDFYLAECLAIRKVVPTVQCKWTVMQWFDSRYQNQNLAELTVTLW